MLFAPGRAVCRSRLVNGTKSNRRFILLPDHGPVSNMSNYVRDVTTNVAWLRALRKFTFNSCNASYVWAEMIRQFPGFGLKTIDMKGVLNTHVPAHANSVNCNHSSGSHTVCPVYSAPPTCPHLDTRNSDATLTCNMRQMIPKMIGV